VASSGDRFDPYHRDLQMATPDPALDRLREIKHIVVLMMENRSFDHMLGYLKQFGMPEVNGLDGTETNPDPAGQEYQVFEWSQQETVFHPAQDETGKILDPCHGKDCVAQQIANGNRGFIKNFLATRENKNGEHVDLPPEYHAFPMGHYGQQHLPAYDFLARNFCVCDSWHSSVPGDTWPNRLFALAGLEADRAAESLLERLAEDIKHLLPVLKNAPIYDVPAFPRELGDEQWRWYSQDPATLRAADAHYRDFTDIKRANFAFFDRQRLDLLEKAIGAALVTPDSFLDDAASGRLRDVSWIDPNFIDLKVLHPNSDDDHPPSDIRAGQALALEVYEALSNSRDWEDTLFVIVYDEHGGFYDHVVPPGLGFDDGSGYKTYGVRVPALVIGPRVANTVSHDLFDHTSLINTILTRFAPDPAQAIANMGPRVQHAKHLGGLLKATARTDIPEPDEPRQRIAEWQQQARAKRRGTADGPSAALDGAGRPFSLHDFQEDFARFALLMRHNGLPWGEP
jgi:phospholipase C